MFSGLTIFLEPICKCFMCMNSTQPAGSGLLSIQLTDKQTEAQVKVCTRGHTVNPGLPLCLSLAAWELCHTVVGLVSNPSGS